MAQSGSKSPEKHQVKSPFGLHVTTYVGDIMDAVADAIVTPEDKTMSHASFVTKALMKQDILFELDREELRKRKLTFPLWTVCTSRMKEQVVYHAFLSACKEGEHKQWTLNMKKLYNNLFREADKMGTLVVAMPLLGAGISNIEEAVHIAVSSVAAYKPKTVTDVLFVSSDEYIVDQIASQCEFEFKGRPQADRTKRSVSFKLTEDEDDDEEEQNSKSRSKHKTSKTKGRTRRGRGVKFGGSRTGRRGSTSSVQSNDSDVNESDRKTVRNRVVSKKNIKTSRRVGTKDKVQKVRSPEHFNYEDPIDEESSDDIKKYKTYKKLRKVKYSPASSEEQSSSDDENVVRPTMKGSRVSVDGKTYDMNVKFEGSPLLKSAEDVREKVIGKNRESLKETPREPLKPVQQSKPKVHPQTSQPYKIKPTQRPPAAKIQDPKPVPKLNLSPTEPELHKEEELDTPRRTKSGELGRTRKRSQSLAAKVAEELEVLRAEHEMKSSKTNVIPSIVVNGESEGPAWSGGKGHIFTPQANALSNQNRSSWSSDEEDQKRDVEESNIVPDCPICLRVVRDPKTLDKCKHVFCRECIDNSFAAYKPVCPSCNTVYGVITGNQPDGTMDVALSDDRLPGYSRYDTIVITYTFRDGTQGQEHPDPGEPYKGTTRKAYLPNNTKGTEVLRLLRTAFKRKLIFTIVRSGSDDECNVVTWNDIHHKTSMKGGPTRFGYPDKAYLTQVKEELAKKGVTE